ncbi:ras-specific guanine nucleotide-releasing factor 2-like isoform [Sesbania bispinosa]|nr:ras-specific guanine nucleotide-releasing factor 2-like isoform [Sesbania bispinosa]
MVIVPQFLSSFHGSATSLRSCTCKITTCYRAIIFSSLTRSRHRNTFVQPSFNGSTRSRCPICDGGETSDFNGWEDDYQISAGKIFNSCHNQILCAMVQRTIERASTLLYASRMKIVATDKKPW